MVYDHAKQVKVPDSIHITGGMYGVRGTTSAEWHINPQSDYVVDVIEGKLKLCVRENGQHIAIADMIDPHPAPKYRSKRFEDGTTYGEVVDAVPGRPFTRFLAIRTCQRWDYEEQCLYCDLNVTAQRLVTLRKRSTSRMIERVDQAEEALTEAYLR